MNYNPAAAGSWRFPYIDGHLRAYELGSLSTTGQDFAANATWDAATLLPPPGSRNIFTTVGGNANLGWSRINWDWRQTDPATCAAPSGITDSAGNRVCDLSMKLAKCATAGVTQQQLLAGNPNAAKLGMFVQQVRGWCAAHNSSTGAAILEPTAAQCDNPSSRWQRNVAVLGGVDHSSPAIVGPTPYLGDTTLADGTPLLWSKRPVVAYFGARDGMLHAVYVSGDTSWTAGGASLPAGIRPGTELWAFVPPGQLCGLATNSAMVDASVNVMDVFGNFPRDANGDGVFDLTNATERPNGRREWRTVLLATSGEGGAEIFALDVTNPLKPVLLWHVDGPSNSDDRFDLNADGDFADAADHMDRAKPQSYALKWFNSDDGTQGTHPWIPTAYNTTSSTVLDGLKSGRYDFHNLGYASGTAIGTLWAGNAFQFVGFVTTSAADFVTDPNTPFGYKGVEVFAVDVVTGQKLWQWENRYTRKNASGTVIADNGTPGRAALVDTNADGSVDRLYVGDLEGHLWELSAVDGRNLNYLPASTGGFKSFPFWGTPPMVATGDAGLDALFKPTSLPNTGELAQQPLTSPVGVGRFTVVPTALQPYLQNRIAIAQGTMGVDWSIAPTQPGHLYVAPVFPETNTRVTGTLSPTSKTVDPLLSGVLLDAAVWDTPLEIGERIFGMPKIVGNEIFANTSYGSFTGDITSTLNDQGRTLRIGATGATNLDTGQKRFGGALIFGKDVVVTSDVGIVRKSNAAGTGGVGNRVFQRFTPVAPKAWELKPTNDQASFVR
jgi:type IV pilus assembly protein PilY1